MAALVAAGASVLLASPASADVGDPVGPPYRVLVNSTAQKAIATGSTAAPGTIVCVTTAGTACAISAPLTGIVTVVVNDTVVCPNGQTREIIVQDVESSPWADVAGGLTPMATSSTCVAP